ncbi:unnamed protein product [Brassica rapa]|uniref:UDP-glucose 4-epimerase n=1 Tax=Brassica campestris TaxID=3711 RepID=A0A3P5YPL8_BRACM|nr:unnamed protein product [Brassica rapa]VDC65544.1 unnamed protein product [Brassica rapa]
MATSGSSHSPSTDQPPPSLPNLGSGAGVCIMSNAWKDEQDPSLISFISSYLGSNSLRLNFVSISPDLIFNCGGVSIAFVFVTKWDDCCNVGSFFNRVKRLETQFARLYVVATLSTKEQNDSFMRSYFQYEMEFGKPAFVLVTDAEMGFEKIVKFSQSRGMCKQQKVASKVKVERKRAVQDTDTFIRVLTSIPNIDKHDANSLYQAIGSIDATAKTSKEDILANTDLSADKTDILCRFFQDPEFYLMGSLITSFVEFVEMDSSMEQNILVTGGAGFIGTHTAVQLLKEGFKVSIIDNLDNSVLEAVDRVRELVGPDLSKKLEFNLGDLRNKEDIEKLFSKQRFDAVIHFAALKGVGESVGIPRRYYDNNLVGTINLYETMSKYNCKMMVFSSSATVYGEPKKIPCLFLEEIARDIHRAEPEWRIVLLRYFNPVGAHESGRIGEDPKGIPNNLMPYIQQVAVGRQPELNVYGHDYPTKDGSAVRDYIHVMDLADGHIAALRKLFTDPKIGCTAYNLGTGRGTSVLEMVAAFEKASGKKIPMKLCPRRPGDSTVVYASTEKAEKELGWKAKYGVDEMCRDQWNWTNNNPWGYQKKL